MLDVGKLEVIRTNDENSQLKSVLDNFIHRVQESGEVQPEKLRRFMNLALDHGVDLSESKEVQWCVAELLKQFEEYKSAYSENTIKQLTVNWHLFLNYCIKNNLKALPASNKTVIDFLKSHTHYHNNTIKSLLWSIGKMHNLTGMPNPIENEYVKLTRQNISNVKLDRGEYVTQSNAMNDSDIEMYFEHTKNPKTVQQYRNRLAISFAYDSMLRPSELIRVRFDDISLNNDGSGSVNMRVSKANKNGRDDYRYLSEDTIRLLVQYIEALEFDLKDILINEDMLKLFIFVGCTSSGKVRVAKKHDMPFTEKPLHRHTMQHLFHTAGKLIGKNWTSYSARIGAAQDLLRDGASLVELQDAGGWSSPTMPIRYSRGASVANSAMAKMRKKKSARA